MNYSKASKHAGFKTRIVAGRYAQATMSMSIRNDEYFALLDYIRMKMIADGRSPQTSAQSIMLEMVLEYAHNNPAHSFVHGVISSEVDEQNLVYSEADASIADAAISEYLKKTTEKNSK